MEAQTKQAILEKYEPFKSETIVAENISYEDFLHVFDGKHAEWYQGKVILVVATTLKHHDIIVFLIYLFSHYFIQKPIGRFIQAPFSMDVSDELPKREPDLMIILNEHFSRIKNSSIEGPADIAIEIVSPESVERDHGKKFLEYEMTGVREYWIFDPARQITEINVLGEDKFYHRAEPDSLGRVVSTLLPGFALDPAILWQEKLPNIQETLQLVQKMVEG